VRRDRIRAPHSNPTLAKAAPFQVAAAGRQLGKQAGKAPALAWSLPGKNRGSARPGLSSHTLG
jgi:hypothetical protein